MRPILKTTLVLCFVLFACLEARAQQYLKSNEKLVMSFNTLKGKRIVLAMDTSGKYLVYRYGSRKHIEQECPADMDEGHKQCKLFHYMRGGGVQNNAEELTQLQFAVNGSIYKIYDNWYAVGNRSEIGVIIPGTQTSHGVVMKAAVRTKRGGLGSLIDNDALVAANTNDN